MGETALDTMPTNGAARIILAEAIEGYRYAYGPFTSLRQLRDDVGRSIIGLDWVTNSGAHSRGGGGYRIWRADPSARANSIGTIRVGSLKPGIIGELERIGDGLLLWSNYYISRLPIHVDLRRVATASHPSSTPKQETPLSWTDLLSNDYEAVDKIIWTRDITRDALFRLTDPEQANQLEDNVYSVVATYLQTRVAPKAREPDVIEALIDSPAYEILLSLSENSNLSADHITKILYAGEDMAADEDEWHRLLMNLAIHPNVGKPTADGDTPADVIIAYGTGDVGVLELLWNNEAIPEEKRRLYHEIARDLDAGIPDFPEPEDAGPILPPEPTPEPTRDWDTSAAMDQLQKNPELKPQELAHLLGTRDVSSIAKWMRQNKSQLPKPVAKPKMKAPRAEPEVSPPIAPVARSTPVKPKAATPQVKPKPVKTPKQLPTAAPAVDLSRIVWDATTPGSYVIALIDYIEVNKGWLPASWDIEVARRFSMPVKKVKHDLWILKTKFPDLWNILPDAYKVHARSPV